MNNIIKIIFLGVILPISLSAKIYPGVYTCYSGDRVSKFRLSSSKAKLNLLYEKNNRRYKGSWVDSFGDAELTLFVTKSNNFSSSVSRTIEYLLSNSDNNDESQFKIYKMINGRKNLFCYATGIINTNEINENNNTKQQIIINNNINYIGKEK